MSTLTAVHVRAPVAYRGKRLLDVTAAFAALLLLVPLLVLLVLLVGLTSRGPVFYGSPRLGFGGRHFRAWKFRTMVVDADSRLEALLDEDPDALEEYAASYKLRNDPRVTAVGRVLRRLSLDELPQFVNVLSGDMSLVGPRPILLRQEHTYPALERYLSVRPGLTGPWQVSARGEVTEVQRAEMDATYIEEQSLATDLQLVAATVPAIFNGPGAW